ncbi:MAG: hypothetical protein NTZ12_02035 [Candidatus Aminicenantes bacterium]|nr:hypothetical protein [Candidatus Aminicenantes bacterium]
MKPLNISSWLLSRVMDTSFLSTPGSSISMTSESCVSTILVFGFQSIWVLMPEGKFLLISISKKG